MTSSTTSALAARLDGKVLLPGDRGFDEARTVWNAMIDRRPRLIVQCASVADVVAAVRTARDLDLEIGVRCGGHSIVGHAVPDDGLMIDLTPMGAIRVDPERRRAWVQGGALLGALDHASQQHDLATTAGNVSHTGVGGLTLGGGMGWLARQFGLSCDNVVACEMVTAEGQVVRASESERSDLFWGLRGGGGNFGIVTEFEFVLHPVEPQVLFAEFGYPPDRAASVLRDWRELSMDAPRRATFMASAAAGTVTIGFVWIGPPDKGRAIVPQLRALGHAVAERVVETTYVDLQRREDTPQGHALRRYWKGHYFRQLADEAIDAYLRHAVGTHGVAASLQAYGGAIAEVRDDDTAFSHRDTKFEYVAAARWTEPGEDQMRLAAARQLAGALEPFASGAYVNTLTDEGSDGVRRAYRPEKLARLRRLKTAYDPDNVFHLNQNIEPL
jgi:FAD/FMN-containing dehydrogenase